MILLPECDVNEDIPSNDDRILHSDDHESSAGTPRVTYFDHLVEGNFSPSPNDETGSQERKSVALETAQVDAGPADSVVSLPVQTDEICENQSKNEDALENFDRSGGFPKEVDATKMPLTLPTSTLLNVYSSCSNVRPENYYSHVLASARLRNPFRLKSEISLDQKCVTSSNASIQVENLGTGMCDPDFETTKISVENLTYYVDRLFALDPSLSIAYGHGPSWTIDFSEDSRKLIFKRKVKERKGGCKRPKQDEGPSLSGRVDCSISSDDLEAEDDVLGRPLWRRQYKSINALVS
ncbi:hypothetical protein Mapa_003642 [Marchantia paleacea]|nr:hypothetical protein Mapa_003642 [Marchantia paleacea]